MTLIRWTIVAWCGSLLVACASAERRDDATPAAASRVIAAGEPADESHDEPVLPVTIVDDTGTTVEVESVDRIIPVDGDLAEIVFALGLGDRVVATDLSATYPPEADGLPQIGYQRALSTEPIARFEPTVVLATDLAQPVETLEQLRDLQVPVVVIDRDLTIGGPMAKVRAVAEALGVPARGEALAAQMVEQVDAAVELAQRTDFRPRVMVLYLRGASTQLIFGAGTGVDSTLAAVGAVDVATELGVAETRQLTAEAMLVAAPDVIVVTTTGLESVGGIDGLLAINGIGRTPAGRQRQILAYEDQYLLGMGPRYGQLLGELAADLAAMAG